MFGIDPIEEGIFARIPLKTGGQLFVSPMPYGPYDRFNRLIKLYRRHRIRRAVVLVTDEEIRAKAKRNILKVYEQNGIEVLRLQIQDLASPLHAGISAIIPQIEEHLQTENVVIHCNAGVGRTGIVAACLIKQMRLCSGDEALAYVQQHMQVRLTDEQQRFVRQWSRELECSNPPLPRPATSSP